MSLILSGTDGLSDVDGSASTPAIRGTDANTGIFFPAADTIAFAEGGAEVARFDSSGNLGIGTTSPSSFASTTNLALGTGSSSAALTVFTGTAQTGAVYFADGTSGADRYRGAIEYSHSSNALLFTTDASERMRIDSGGDVAINNTGLTGCRFGVSEDGSLRNAIGVNNTASGSGSQPFVSFQRNTTQTGTISNTNSATAYNTSSDYRLKENIAPMTGALAKVTQLKPCNWTWKLDGSVGQGFIAHELQAVVPDCVTGEKDGEQMQGVDTSYLVATLTAAIQELKAIVDAQAIEIAELKAK
jgi:hypothetical protein